MKYIIGVLLSILVIGMVACGNDGGESAVKRKLNTDYSDFNIYYGAEKGATRKLIDTIKIVERKDKEGVIFKDTIYLDTDSLYKTYTSTHYFSSKAAEVRESNIITFEFLDNDLLVYTYREKSNTNQGYQIIAPYLYKGDALYILKDEKDEVFVAYKEKNGAGFYRTATLLRTMIDEDGKMKDEIKLVDDEVLDLNEATKQAGFVTSNEMTNPNDSVIWCNVKFIYR